MYAPSDITLMHGAGQCAKWQATKIWGTLPLSQPLSRELLE